VKDSDLALGRVYPDLSRIREVSAAIGTAVAEVAFARGLTHIARPADLAAYVKASMFEATYPEYA